MQANHDPLEAAAANAQFDAQVQSFLKLWIARHPQLWKASGLTRNAYRDGPAVDDFFRTNHDALEQLLRQPHLREHLCRRPAKVHFTERYQPLMSVFEEKIYDAAALIHEMDIPFRHPHLVKGDAHYLRHQGKFYMRRATDESVEMHNGLMAMRNERLPGCVHVPHGGLMDALIAQVGADARAQNKAGVKQDQIYILRQRWAMEEYHNGHLIAAVLVMDPQAPLVPKRVIFCDTGQRFAIDKTGKNTYNRARFLWSIHQTFPLWRPSSLADASMPLHGMQASTISQQGDANCAMYTANLAAAFLEIAHQEPSVLLQSPDSMRDALKKHLPMYYTQGELKSRGEIEYNHLAERWNHGRMALLAYGRAPDAPQSWVARVRHAVGQAKERTKPDVSP